MTVNMFLIMLAGFSALTALATEAVKKIFENPKCNVIALVTAMIIGCGGTLIYYQLSYINFSVNNCIYAGLMGLASCLVAMTSYDKVVQTIKQFLDK